MSDIIDNNSAAFVYSETWICPYCGKPDNDGAFCENCGCNKIVVQSFETKSTVKKPFKNITKKGLEYGENRNDKHNLNETHPEWYVDKFGELLERLGVSQGNMFE